MEKNTTVVSLADLLAALAETFSATPFYAVERVVGEMESWRTAGISMKFDFSSTRETSGRFEIQGKTTLESSVDYNQSAGEIEVVWVTTSGHLVIIRGAYNVPRLRPAPARDGESFSPDWLVTELALGDDESSSFYPTMRQVAEELGIPLS